MYFNLFNSDIFLSENLAGHLFIYLHYLIFKKYKLFKYNNKKNNILYLLSSKLQNKRQERSLSREDLLHYLHVIHTHDESRETDVSI